MNLENQRLSKVLAAAGVASRRHCEELIFAGKVTVNGAVVVVPQTRVDPSQDKIAVLGKALAQTEKKVYYALNKPSGYLCTNLKKGERSKVIFDLFQDSPFRLFSVGRLDKETQGLILVTNDGHFANKVMHPSFGVLKEYVAKTQEEITLEHLEKISRGLWLEGSYVRPKKVKKVRKGTIKVIIGEGKKREVRHLLEQAGLTILELTRTRIGSLVLGSLPVGSWRELSEDEKQKLFQ